jgi:hypothetical protein
MIETIVGIDRHQTKHYARAISAEQVVYVLHSHACWDAPIPLQDCEFSLALEHPIDELEWAAYLDRPVPVLVDEAGRLAPQW